MQLKHKHRKPGEKIGAFMLLNRVKAARAGAWLVSCSHCEKVLVKIISDMHKQQSCGCLHFHKTRANAVSTNMYCHLRNRHSKYEGEIISFEYFLHLSEGNCKFCNAQPSNAAKDDYSNEIWKYNGIDRINSHLGYIKGNVQSCCIRCNVAKSNIEENEFIAHVARIYEHLKLANWKQLAKALPK